LKKTTGIVRVWLLLLTDRLLHLSGRIKRTRDELLLEVQIDSRAVDVIRRDGIRTNRK
jgi:hypothetical protein